MRKVVKTEELYSDLSGDKTEKLLQLNFTFDGKRHRLEVTPAEMATYEGIMAPYVEAAQKARADAGKSDDERNDDTQEIREWARANGYDVAEKGRVAAKVQAAFYEAQAKAEEDNAAKSKS